MNKKVQEFIRKVKYKTKLIINVKDTKGAITLMLAVLIVPFVTICGSLVNTARVNSAVAIFDEALCNASNSTLGTYDSFLRERFGLLALSQNLSTKTPGYTAENLINDTFSYYMEENLKTLKNTYSNTTYSATGIYPLSNPDILKSKVLESGKYSVPAKMVIDGFSIDDLLKKLTKNWNMVNKVLKGVTTASDTVGKMKSLQDKIDSAKAKLDTLVTKTNDYDAKYSSFSSSINSYNAKVDEMNNAIASYQNDINNKQSILTEKNTLLQQEKDKIPDIISQLEYWENEKDAEGRKVDNTELIKTYKEENKEKLKGVDDATEAVQNAQNELQDAKNRLNAAKQSYQRELTTLRTGITNSKSEYLTSISGLMSSVSAAGEAVIEVKSTYLEVVNKCVSLVGDVAGAVEAGRNQILKNENEDYNKQLADAEKKEDQELISHYKELISDNKEKITVNENEDSITKAFVASAKEGVNGFNDFSNQDFQEAFSNVYNRLSSLYSRTENYNIPANDVKAEGAESYYEGNIIVVRGEDLDALQQELYQTVIESTFFGFVQACVSFIRALVNLTVRYDPDLCARIDLSKYAASTGGLPSAKDRRNNPIESPYAEADSQKSEYYKEQIGGFENNPEPEMSVATMLDAFTEIFNAMDSVGTTIEGMSAINIFFSLGNILSSIVRIVTLMINLCTNIMQVINEGIAKIGKSLLLDGYIAYNTANRTTYTGKALTGASYSLPNTVSRHQGYSFYGAETEYIITGTLDEVDNQKNVFSLLYLIRVVLNMIYIIPNPEVMKIVSAAASATFGIGGIIVLALYLIIEPFIDSIIIANGGKVPLIKTKIYLTPSGVPELINDISCIKLKESEEAAIKDKLAGVMKIAKEDITANEFKNNANSTSLLDVLSFDYTKSLLLILLFTNNETELERLADIIQMEGMYNAVDNIAGYTFDLDKSYTYLRASGKFSTNQFVKLSEITTDLTSKERVIYKGY